MAGSSKRRRGAAGHGRELLGLVAAAVTIYLTLCLVSYEQADPGFLQVGPRSAAVSNWGGPVGAYVADGLLQVFGLSALVIPFLLAFVSYGSFTSRLSRPGLEQSAGIIGALLSLSVFLRLFLPDVPPVESGGVVGKWVGGFFVSYTKPVGAFVIALFGLAVSLRIGLGLPIAPLRRRADRLAGIVGAAAGRLGVLLRHGAVRVRMLWMMRQERIRRARAIATERPRAPAERPRPASAAGSSGPVPSAAAAQMKRERAPAEGLSPVPVIGKRAKVRPSQPKQVALGFDRGEAGKREFKLPGLSMLDVPDESERGIDRDSLIARSKIVEHKLADFGVEGRIVKVHPGPVVTLYEFEPAPGVKINRIVNLQDDLAMALKALSVRIVAPLPGRAAVGIEVPNEEREPIYLRDLLGSAEFDKATSQLTIALGKDISGAPVLADLTAMPHLLVAGATGTGKSVFLNALLCSILYRSKPDDVKILLIDPKLLELSVYESIPHLISKVVTDPKRASWALGGIVAKMEERYRLMADKGVRNIVQYNRHLEEEEEEGHVESVAFDDGETKLEHRRLPYIVVIVDELADLMVVSSRDVEESLTRLAQMARAAGIHLVLATQRPSVDVLTGVIKANFPCRISFQVSSRVDSRTVIDMNGAETLLGLGDMLFLPPGTSKLRRIHGAYVSEKEIKRVVDFLKEQARPEYDKSLLRQKEEPKENGEDEEDENYDRAVALVCEARQASISYVQRKLRIGYNRAARLVERMEREGIVGRAEAGKPREVLVRSHGDLETE